MQKKKENVWRKHGCVRGYLRRGGKTEKKKTNDDKSRLYMSFCECVKYSLVSVEEK